MVAASLWPSQAVNKVLIGYGNSKVIPTLQLTGKLDVQDRNCGQNYRFPQRTRNAPKPRCSIPDYQQVSQKIGENLNLRFLQSIMIRGLTKPASND
jgi:hypothetical protein